MRFLFLGGERLGSHDQNSRKIPEKSLPQFILWQDEINEMKEKVLRLSSWSLPSGRTHKKYSGVEPKIVVFTPEWMGF